MDPSPYAGSGAGGKIRRRPPPRVAATPYDRPPAAAAAHRLAAAAAAASSGPSGEGTSGGGSSGWVSRLVDPASRLLAGGAARLFSSVFRRRLGPAPAESPPLSSPSGRNADLKQDVPESTYANSSPVLEDGMGKKKLVGMSDDKALSEVEHLLMRKTFTRVEFDRLTDLLRERTIESDLPTSMVSREKNEESTRTNEPGASSHGMAADYSPTVKVLSNVANSPAELAKQYMSSRYSREPQSSSLRSRLFLENEVEASNIAYNRRSGQPVIHERIEFGNGNPGLPVNGYVTPGLRGRSAIYRMSRSPYFKGPSSSGDVNMSSLSQQAQSLHTGGRQVLKRRAAELEIEHGLIGPIRRIRQKSNMVSYKDARANPRGNLSSRTSGSDFTEDSLSNKESPSSKRLLLGPGQSVQLELDDDLEASKNSPSKIEVGTTEEKFDSSHRKEQKVEQKTGPNLLKENVVGSPVNERPNAVSLGLFPPDDPGKTDTTHVTAETNTGFTFSHIPSGTSTGNTISTLPVASVQDNKQGGASISIFGSKQSSTSNVETSTAADAKNKAGLVQSVTKPTALDSTSSEKGHKREKAENVIQSSDTMLSSAASTTNAPLHFASTASSTSSLSNGFSYSSSPKPTPDDKPALSSAPSISILDVSNSTSAISSSNPSPAFSFGSSVKVGSSMASSGKSEITEAKPATTLTFGIGATTAECKSTAPDSANKSPSTLFTLPISSNISTFSSSSISSASIFSNVSSSPVAASSVASSTATTAPSSTAPGVQSASTASFILSSSGSVFGFSSPAQSAGLSTSVPPSTSQPPAASAVFGSKTTQSEATVSQPPQSSVAQFGSSFPASGVGASSAGSGAISFGVGTSSSAPGTVVFGAAASSSGPGIFSFGAGTSSSGSETVSFGLVAGAASSGPGTVSFGAAGAVSSGPGTLSHGAGAASSGPGTASFGVGATSSGPGTVSFGVGAASSGPVAPSFGVGAASSGSGTFSFSAGAASSGSGSFSFSAGVSSSGPGTVSFGSTTSASASGFGSSQFGAGSTLSTPFSSNSGTGFAFSSPSSSAVSSTVASTSVFSSSPAAPSTSFSNPFGSSSSQSSIFTFGQSASSGGGFAFGAQSAPAFSSQPSVFTFSPANTSVNSSTMQPAFGMTNTNTGFGAGSTGNFQMNDDSMADDTNQAVPTPAPIFGSSPFGQQGNSPAAPVFGAPSVQPDGVFQFGGQQQGSAPQNPAFPPGGSLEFQSGGFSLGSAGTGGDKSNRRVIKVKRGPKKR